MVVLADHVGIIRDHNYVPHLVQVCMSFLRQNLLFLIMLTIGVAGFVVFGVLVIHKMSAYAHNECSALEYIVTHQPQAQNSRQAVFYNDIATWAERDGCK
jgi:hypothetical protein